MPCRCRVELIGEELEFGRQAGRISHLRPGRGTASDETRVKESKFSPADTLLPLQGEAKAEPVEAWLPRGFRLREECYQSVMHVVLKVATSGQAQELGLRVSARKTPGG